MELYNGKPIINLTIKDDDDSGMNRLSLVDNPAIQTEWMLFQDINKFNKIVDEDRRLITSPIMLANFPILREYRGIYFYVEFSPESIMEMMKKYFITNKIHNINEMHDQHKIVDNIYMVESYIVDNRNKSLLYPDVPLGSWIATYYVDDKQYWNDKVKNGNFRGVSLEGKFDYPLEDIIYFAVESILNDKSLSEEEKYDKISKILE